MNTMSEPAFKKASELFQEVTKHDSGFAPAYASSAILHAAAGQYGPFFPDVVYGKVNELASRALALAPELPEAHVALGMAHMFHQADFEAAEKCFRCALDLNPSSVLANQLYSQVSTVLCRHSQAIDAMRRAHELDPLSPIPGTMLACAYFFAGQFEPAREQIDRVLMHWPECASALATAGWVLTELGDYDLALARYHQALDMHPRSPLWMVNLAYGLAAAGRSGEALRLLHRVIETRRQVWVSSYWIALVYCRLCRDQEALLWFNQAEQEHDGWRILCKTDPRFRPPSAQQMHLVSFYDVISQ
jgi:tetratricopeptide (TPR) repeat protein